MYAKSSVYCFLLATSLAWARPQAASETESATLSPGDEASATQSFLSDASIYDAFSRAMPTSLASLFEQEPFESVTAEAAAVTTADWYTTLPAEVQSHVNSDISVALSLISASPVVPRETDAVTTESDTTTALETTTTTGDASSSSSASSSAASDSSDTNSSSSSTAAPTRSSGTSSSSSSSSSLTTSAVSSTSASAGAAATSTTTSNPAAPARATDGALTAAGIAGVVGMLGVAALL